MSPTPDEAAPAGEAPHQFRLLGQRRFAPFFWTVFLGAVNDNLLKLAVVLILTYQVKVPWLPPEVVGPALGGIFILPSVLLSATCGQWVDRSDLAALMRLAKSAEVLMMGLAAWALWAHNVPALLLSVLLSGVHVTVFSTVKYAYVPRHLHAGELTGGNGLLEMGMFTAILLGTVCGGVLVAPRWGGVGMLVAALLGLALLGRAVAQRIPATPSLSPAMKINWNPLKETWRNLERIHHDGVLLLCLLGISWMWFFGAVFLGLFPILSKTVLHADEDIASLLLVFTSLGIAAGALLCEWLGRERDPDAPPDMGLVLVGALGMGVFGVDLGWVLHGMAHDPAMAAIASYGMGDFLARPLHWRGLLDQVLMSVSIGLFSVPLYAQMQYRAEPERRARVVAANNILNAAWILVSAFFTWVLSAHGWSVGTIFAATALCHLLVTAVTLWWQPMLWRETVAWLRRWRRDGGASAQVR
jgi:hypothetical protein